MSASELIQQWKALPATERDAFSRLFQELKTLTPQAETCSEASAGAGNWPDFGDRLKRIYGNRVVADSDEASSHARGDW